MKIRSNIIFAIVFVMGCVIALSYFFIDVFFAREISNLKIVLEEKYNAIKNLNYIASEVSINEELYKKSLKNIIKLQNEQEGLIYIIRGKKLYLEYNLKMPEFSRINNNALDLQIIKNSPAEDVFYPLNSSAGNEDFSGIFKSYAYNGEKYFLGYIIPKSATDFKFKLLAFLSGLALMFVLFMTLHLFLFFSRYIDIVEYISEKLFQVKNKILVADNIKESKDEFGSMVVNLNDAITKYKLVVAGVKDLSSSSYSLQDKIKTSANNSLVNIENSLKIQESIKKDIEDIRNETLQIKEALKFASDDSYVLYTETNASLESSKEFKTVVYSIENKLNEFKRNFENKVENWTSLIGQVETSKSTISSFVSGIKDINKSSGEIINALALINSITAKTSMLSMNASIQAAHAGEYGKGFSVVAGEIQKLAEASQERTSYITKVVKELKNKLDFTNEGSENSEVIFEHLIQEISENHSSQKEILESIDALSQESRDVTQEFEKLNTSSHKIKEKSNSLIENVHNITLGNSSINEKNQELLEKSNASARSLENSLFELNNSKKYTTKIAKILTTIEDEMQHFKFTLKYEKAENKEEVEEKKSEEEFQEEESDKKDLKEEKNNIVTAIKELESDNSATNSDEEGEAKKLVNNDEEEEVKKLVNNDEEEEVKKLIADDNNDKEGEVKV